MTLHKSYIEELSASIHDAFNIRPVDIHKVGTRSFRIYADRAQYILKIATEKIEADALEHEINVLQKLTTRIASLYKSSEKSMLLLNYVEGTPLSNLSGFPKSIVLNAVTKIHQTGYIFCDISPTNILVSDKEAIFIDWEYCTPKGTKISAMPRRPFTSGFTSPNLIWQRGVLSEQIDYFSIDRMLSQGFLTNT